jgi:hypothetical protein
VKEAAVNGKKKRKLFLLAVAGYRGSDHMTGVASSLAVFGNQKITLVVAEHTKPTLYFVNTWFSGWYVRFLATIFQLWMSCSPSFKIQGCVRFRKTSRER